MDPGEPGFALALCDVHVTSHWPATALDRDVDRTGAALLDALPDAVERELVDALDENTDAPESEFVGALDTTAAHVSELDTTPAVFAFL